MTYRIELHLAIDRWERQSCTSLLQCGHIIRHSTLHQLLYDAHGIGAVSREHGVTERRITKPVHKRLQKHLWSVSRIVGGKNL